MWIQQLSLSGLFLMRPKAFTDERGYFCESYNQRSFEEAIGRAVTFVQDNHSASTCGVVRGLHYQLPPHPQAKLIRAVVGEIFDVAVDIRRSSPTFGRWEGVRLSAENRLQLFIPEGFAHGFVAVSDRAEVVYKASDYYAPDAEAAIAWRDPELAIDWPNLAGLIVSTKDAAAPSLAASRLFA